MSGRLWGPGTTKDPAEAETVRFFSSNQLSKQKKVTRWLELLGVGGLQSDGGVKTETPSSGKC